jgi:hypothetical protein
LTTDDQASGGSEAKEVLSQAVASLQTTFSGLKRKVSICLHSFLGFLSFSRVSPQLDESNKLAEKSIEKISSRVEYLEHCDHLSSQVCAFILVFVLY